MQSRAAMTSLCEAYADPVLAFIRRRVESREQAEDMAQEFFSRLISGELLQRADPEIGRFRSFLLHEVRCYLADARDFENALKRGGDVVKVSLSAAAVEPMHETTPEMEFELRWVRALLRRALQQLESEYQDGSRCQLFLALKEQLDSGRKVPTRQIAAELRMSDAAVRVALHRMRTRLGLLIRQEIADTLPVSADIGDEIMNLKRVLEQTG